MEGKDSVNDSVKPIVPGRNGGTLLPGGLPGNRGGLGKPKSEIRARLAASFEERIPILEGIADNPKSYERLKAIDLMAKYSGLAQMDITSGDQPLNGYDLSKLDPETELPVFLALLQKIAPDSETE